MVFKALNVPVDEHDDRNETSKPERQQEAPKAEPRPEKGPKLGHGRGQDRPKALGELLQVKPQIKRLVSTDQ